MRTMIEGKHLGKSTTIDMKTGKETPSNTKMSMLPAKEGTCEHCAVAHEPEAPHNAQSLFYQMRFFNEHNRWPTWLDALAHCSEKTKDQWTTHLKELGVDVDAGHINPRGKK